MKHEGLQEFNIVFENGNRLTRNRFIIITKQFFYIYFKYKILFPHFQDSKHQLK